MFAIKFTMICLNGSQLISPAHVQEACSEQLPERTHRWVPVESPFHTASGRSLGNALKGCTVELTCFGWLVLHSRSANTNNPWALSGWELGENLETVWRLERNWEMTLLRDYSTEQGEGRNSRS